MWRKNYVLANYKPVEESKKDQHKNPKSVSWALQEPRIGDKK
jgi:hypothetical protein